MSTAAARSPGSPPAPPSPPGRDHLRRRAAVAACLSGTLCVFRPPRGDGAAVPIPVLLTGRLAPDPGQFPQRLPQPTPATETPGAACRRRVRRRPRPVVLVLSLTPLLPPDIEVGPDHHDRRQHSSHQLLSPLRLGEHIAAANAEGLAGFETAPPRHHSFPSGG